ncbi:MAG: YggS family pyridoxal phosphate-dependent enzyme [Prevotellaceae bacterium]|jgi:pyridoxal phosphate enzyme (YggS family)|nr:YggS family pyridoxal phosphate-dependent enzyme [Prevotellaceae bacterium]
MNDKIDVDYRLKIRDNLRVIHERISSACRNAGRDESSVRLLLATKTIAPEAIRIAIEAGENLVGENKMQEFAAKYEALADLKHERHFIGHLQSNKVKDALKYVTCIETVDSMDLARKLDKYLSEANRSIDIMIQVNTSFEKSKSGLNPDETLPFLRDISTLKTLNTKGFMTIGLLDSEPEKVRPSYAKLREIRDAAAKEGLVGRQAELSMGMSGDLEIAINEGATIVRVGSAVFGTRISGNKNRE